MRRRKKQQQYKRPTNCIFCKEKFEPDYKQQQKLAPFVSDRGRITGRGRSGVCSKHQRSLAKAIKRARFLAFLPYTHKV